MKFHDREEAGKQLARLLMGEIVDGASDGIVVCALPRGGVAVAAEVARALGAPLDVVGARKVGHPLTPEYAIGAVAADGHMLINQREAAFLDKKWLMNEIGTQRREAQRRLEAYRAGIEIPSMCDKTVILVDDGIATGFTMHLALSELAHESPSRIIVAIPVIPKEIMEEFKKNEYEIIAAHIPEVYAGAVGAYYHNFAQVMDEDVKRIMRFHNSSIHAAENK